MTPLKRLCIGMAAAAATAAGVHAGTEEVALPADYQTDFVRYEVVDRLDRKKARFMYMNADAWAAAEPGQPLPDGTVVIMEDHDIRLDGAGEPVLDSAGRVIPTDVVTNVFIMEKRAGWGADYPDELRNGEWEYAWFGPDGVRSFKPMTACFECHKAQDAEDYTFTAVKAVAAQK